MAIRVQVTEKAGTRYVSVVQDLHAEGRRAIRTLKSFGPESPESLARAFQFKANCEAVQEMAKGREANADDVWKAILAVFGLILGIAVITWLLTGNGENEGDQGS